MSDRTPIPLTPALIDLDSPEFETICGWPFADSYVGRLLQDDIPQRIQNSYCQVWVYRDPDGRLVGFGTFDVCEDCRQYAERPLHSYVPLLAVNPAAERRGHGTSIVRHLIGEAAILARRSRGYYDVLFLDVYTANESAISLYRKCGFATLTDEPIPDPKENGKPYIIMAKRIIDSSGLLIL
jgi:ribosomal protein S18 acetylase RimI-like enzyme